MALFNKQGKQFSAVIEASPLEYHHEGRVRRLSVVDTDFPAREDIRKGTKVTHFDETTRTVSRNPATGRRYKTPRSQVEPGASPGTAAFVDYTRWGGDVHIDYMKTHPHYENQGLGRAAMEAVYRAHPDSQVHWGKLMSKGSEHLYRDFEKRHPAQTGSAKFGWA